MIRFPEDPKYTCSSSDELEATASKDGSVYRLTVLESSLEALDARAKEIALQPGVELIAAERASPRTFDCHYRIEGKWVWEHLYLTPHHLYAFQTKSDSFQRENHEYFIHSLSL